ncbi:hypothetical protein [Streptomyces flavofungini]|uniref:hypothetical protein n=1 Tax=Streptomyces flavofungini TaxID=68200 RepID=UPI0025B1D28B|nr:hypothetical protein [Streptomyces flavofungini]WJV48802.1 hypothetical protein QUY26_26805 [Streptomyces flavofungini]
MRYARKPLRAVAVCAVATAMLTVPAGSALADNHQTSAPQRTASASAPGAGGEAAAPAFRCRDVGSKSGKTKRKAPIRAGMSKHARIKVKVPKGKYVRYTKRCVSSKGTHWVKTATWARGYLYAAHI